MSIKRQATTELNHDNWDQDDPSEQEEMGVFKSASKDVLEKRVIRTAKRRNQGQSGDDAKKSVFSGFGGFNKSQPSSFDFLANLTNGNKPTNGTSTSKTDTPASSGLFSSKPVSSSPGSGLFSTPVTSSPASKPIFGLSTTSSSLFGGTSTATTQSPFGATKTETSATDSPFKIQSAINSNNTGSSDAFKSTDTKTNLSFGTSLISNNNSNNMSVNKITNTFGVSKTIPVNVAEKKNEQKSEDKKMIYYTKLKGLNESVSDWIKKHVEETPLCILSPIFKDYEKHLKEIQGEYEGKQEESKKPSENSSETKPSAMKASNTINSGSSIFSSTNAKPSLFGNQTSTNDSSDKPSGFTFGVHTTSTTTSGGFSFGVNSTPQTTAAPSSGLFSFAPNTTSGSNGPATFSFSSDKPFSFSANIAQKPAETAKEDKDDEDGPPKVEFTPVVEENSVFDKKCKIFVKKDGNFIDKGVGTLYIKKVEDSNKHQLLVRANTNLGNVLLNLILSSSIPTQRLGKNNVMLACIPTPDAKPPPTPVLIRVKTSEEADQLLDTLDKYKV